MVYNVAIMLIIIIFISIYVPKIYLYNWYKRLQIVLYIKEIHRIINIIVIINYLLITVMTIE